MAAEFGTDNERASAAAIKRPDLRDGYTLQETSPTSYGPLLLASQPHLRVFIHNRPKNSQRLSYNRR
jgi:hypothetical protein